MHIATAGPQLVSIMIKESLGLNCSVLMGANIAEVCTSLSDKANNTEAHSINRQEFKATILMPTRLDAS